MVDYLHMNCEDCGTPASHWSVCWHCGRIVCRQCWPAHRCEPDPRRPDCRSFAAPSVYIARLRARREAVAEAAKEKA